MADFGAFATLVSSFTGADENPLSEGGNWAKLNSADATSLHRTANQVGNDGGTTGSSYWTPATFGPDVEAYVSIPVKPTADGDPVGIVARIQGAGGSGTWDGYWAGFQTQTITDTWFLRTITNNATANTIASGSREFSAGEKMGIRCVGSLIEIWVFTGGAWSLLGSGTETTYPSAGHVAMRIRSVSGRLDDFFAGTIFDIPQNTVIL